MKNKFWLLRIIALAVVIGFVISCSGEKIDPTVNWPVDLTAEYGKTLADITLPDSSVI